MNNRENHHIVLATNSKTKKLHISNSIETVKWLRDNDKYFDEYTDTLTIYCESSEEKAKIRKAIADLQPKS